MSLRFANSDIRARFQKVNAFARAQGGKTWKSWVRNVKYLSQYRGRACECRLYSDHAPQSFYFELYLVKTDDPAYRGPNDRFMNGGLIYHEAYSTGVEFPVLSVTLSPEKFNHWQVHT